MWVSSAHLQQAAPCMRTNPETAPPRRPDGGPESTQYIMNLLQMMDESSVTKAFETFELLIEHWARRRVYGALLATVEDMRAAGLRPGAPQLISAAQKAEAVSSEPPVLLCCCILSVSVTLALIVLSAPPTTYKTGLSHVLDI